MVYHRLLYTDNKFLAEVEFGVLSYNRAIWFCFLLMLEDFLPRKDDDSFLIV
jgi:hypothetical protein